MVANTSALASTRAKACVCNHPDVSRVRKIVCGIVNSSALSVACCVAESTVVSKLKQFGARWQISIADVSRAA